jgi:putative aldouronate transport system substrate-binding protein
VGGAATTMQFLEENDQLIVAPGASYTAPTDDAEVDAIRSQVKATVVEHSWKMVFAKDDAEFESLLASMQETAEGLGVEAVLEVDMANAEAQNEARVAVAKEFG